MVPTLPEKDIPNIDPQVRIALLEYRLGLQETLLKSIDAKIDFLRAELPQHAVVSAEVANLKDTLQRMQTYIVGIATGTFLALLGTFLTILTR